ncbi:Death-inducer obliterator 1 [Takifugu flavidus]|uniref:Death-inducer obliterator 1 n=1 Tax=Takifugu flavidus TaxID=433684 RepID=A0A5C6MRC6_9TELE|nr:Death-inducer obliterator 1 [Takifugu flavidus]
MDKTQEVEAPLKQSAEDSAAHGAPSSQPASEAETPQGHSPETPQEPNNGSVPAATRPCSPPNAEQACQVTVSEAPSTSAPSHHQTEALTVRKKAFIIPKKPPAPQPSSSPVLPSTSGQKPSAAPALVNETRNLLVPPAPSAPSSRPSQPNNQIRQSIQKSLVSILVKRVGECGDLKTSESDVVKLVASIEVEMFDIFRNTDSKYMNKYRTIMFNLKDPRNKGLLYGFVRGEISPFRLVRMTQKDMQAIKASDTSEKQTSEAKDSAATAPPVAKVTSVLPKPEAVKVDLPILNPTRPHRSTVCTLQLLFQLEQKKSLPPPAAKSRTMQPIQSSALPDILTCMLKDTTSEHKTHIFDLKCKICTASPVLESPASPVMDSPASPTPDPPKAFTSKSALMPVVNPAVSMTTMTRRDPRTAANRSVASGSPSVDETSQFLAKQEILWKGFINMLTVAKFVSKAYLVSGPAENLKADLPDTIQIGGRILPETVWDYVDKELCVIRFHPATEEEEVAYVSLFSYFSSRRRFGVVASGNRSIKDLYLVPVGANESVPSMLQPLEGPGLETKRPNLLLGLAIIQRTKRSGIFSQETEEKRLKVHLAKDPMWIPKPPVLYGSDRLDVFQPYDPETPANSAVPSSPLRPGSPPAPSSSLTKPSSFISVRPNLSVALSVTAPAAQSPSTSVSDKPPVTPSGDKTPLQTILSSLFGGNPTESTASTNESSTNISSVKKPPALSQVAATMVDPIVQQYGQKSKIKEIEEENDFDRPYDPEEEYDPAVGYGIPTLKKLEKTPAAGPAVSSCVEDDVAYDPEDDTIFADVSSIAAKRPVQTQMSDPSSCDPPVSTQPATPVPTSTASSDGITPNLPSGTVVVSAATLNEQQRMLEELNKQIEEQKRQLKEQEEALRQQREAVGMFMAQFSASDSMMPPPTKTLPLSQMPSLKAQEDTKPSEMTDKTVERSPEISANAEKQTVEPQDTSVLKEHTDTLIAEDETNTEVKDGETYSSAGEIEDSDVAYDPEDESFFKEVEDGPFEGNGGKTYDRSLSRRSRSTSHKGSQNSSHSRKRRKEGKGIGTEEVIERGPDIEVEVILRGRVAIVKSTMCTDSLLAEDPHHVLVSKIMRLFHQNIRDKPPLNLSYRSQWYLSKMSPMSK